MIAFLLGVPGKLSALMADYTTARAAKIDLLDSAVSTRAPASTALSNLDYTAARAAKLDAVILTSVIASYQSGYVGAAPATGGTGQDARYIDVAIAAVASTAKCVILVNGYHDDGTGNGPTAMARLTSTTNLRISTPQGGAGGAIYARWQVVEFK